MQSLVQATSRATHAGAGILASAAAALSYGVSTPASELTLRVLRTPDQRRAIAGLRKLAAFGVEQDLGLGLTALEQVRDEVGLVIAVYREARVVATLRFVPTGHQLTGAERLARSVEFDTRFLGTGSWEVGRVIMAPEDRHPELLLQCLTLTLKELMRTQDVRHFHATTTLPMARLWRRVGMRSVLTTEGASGARYALVHGGVLDVAAALGVAQEIEATGAGQRVRSTRAREILEPAMA